MRCRAVWNKLVKTDLVRNNNIRFAQGTFAEDQIFTIKCRLSASRIFICPASVYNYRRRLDSCTTIGLPQEKAAERVKLIPQIKDFLVKQNVYEECFDAFWRYAISVMTKYSKRLRKSNKRFYTQEALKIVPPVYHKYYLERMNDYKNIWQWIFSVKKLKLDTFKYKTLTIFGIKIKLKRCH